MKVIDDLLKSLSVLVGFVHLSIFFGATHAILYLSEAISTICKLNLEAMRMGKGLISYDSVLWEYLL